MKIAKHIRPVIAASAFAIAAISATSASATGFGYFNLYHDGTQAFNSRAIAGAAPNALATYQGGIRCQYEYRVQWTPAGPQKIRHQVCN
ncbi:MAG: hypothetical protein AAF362_17415 [Pseudomonadota bacterium]